MPKYLVKRSMSPDGKIDSVSVEIEGEFDTRDTLDYIKAIKNVISMTDEFADHVRNNVQSGAAVLAFKSNGNDTEDAGPSTLTGTIQAVYPGEPSKSGKMGPGAIIVSGTKVKTFDKKIIAQAQAFKQNGTPVEIVYHRNEQWKSNDADSIKEAQG